MTIRNVVMGRLRPDASDDDRAALRAGLDGIAGLHLPGMVANSGGADAGLREGGWSFAIVNDWADEAAYRMYDADPEHNVYRAQIVGACEQVSRVQFVLD